MGKRSHHEHRPHAAAPPTGEEEPLGAGQGVPQEPAQDGDVPATAAEAAPSASAEAVGGREAAAVVDDLARLEREAAELKERLLRTAADFDNFRKRAGKEKAETWGHAQADVIQKVLDSIDDLGRVAHLDPAQTNAEALHEGVGLVERKLLKALDGVGLERLDPSGQAFDPNAHEAVMTTPAPTVEQDGHVAMVFQAGYRLNGLLLRPARVAVYAFTEPPPSEVVH
jgi:molecular chaperone GrpE